MTSPLISPEPPTSGSLLRATLTALGVAAVLLVTCVLPAEYGIDPTGIGRVLGLTQMGEVKLALAEEAASNVAAEASADSVIAAAESGAASVGTAADSARESGTTHVDTTVVTLPPNKGGEIKLVMQSGMSARYQWSVTGGVVDVDMHGDSTNAPKDWFVSYKKANGTVADSGELVAGFAGNHGWYWKNRGPGDVLIRLITSGNYARIEKHL
jgi:hypothetical protein